jgi:uncharacterized membrane protein YeaQ/YmgE (transglycosylase-associated protein family)
MPPRPSSVAAAEQEEDLMAILWCLLFGALLGWVFSLVMRTNSNEGVMVDILVGALGGVALTMALGISTTFDNLIGAYLGATIALAILFLVRRRMRST